MCDTIVALKNSTSTGSVLLAKSADTEVNEAEQIVKYSRKQYNEGTFARTTHIKIPRTTIVVVSIALSQNLGFKNPIKKVQKPKIL